MDLAPGPLLLETLDTPKQDWLLRMLGDVAMGHPLWPRKEGLGSSAQVTL